MKCALFGILGDGQGSENHES